VPEIDRHYVFRPKALMAMLKGMKQGQPIYAHGHTGTGKTTLAEQVCAHLNWPLLIVSLDSDVSRLDFIGRDALVQENGSSVTRFVEGVLPWAMQRPVFMLLDEIDFGRSDILYVLQRVLEGGKLVLTEDGGRIVTPHPMFRIMASGNTRGQGDDSGLYQGARVLSAALIGRFKRWIEVPYLEQDELYKLIDARVPGLDAEFVRKLTQYTLEHQRAFTERQVVTPISPRITMTLAENYRDYLTHMPEQLAREWAIEETVLNRVPDTDRATLKGVLDRIFN
jgi:cobaltochelatase CobS